jgi:hypothetical protein
VVVEGPGGLLEHEVVDLAVAVDQDLQVVQILAPKVRT